MGPSEVAKYLSRVAENVEKRKSLPRLRVALRYLHAILLQERPKGDMPSFEEIYGRPWDPTNQDDLSPSTIFGVAFPEDWSRTSKVDDALKKIQDLCTQHNLDQSVCDDAFNYTRDNYGDYVKYYRDDPNA